MCNEASSLLAKIRICKEVLAREPHFVRAHLHQASASTLRQFSDNACDSVLIENNGVASEWGCNLFSSNSTDFNENRIVSVIAELS